MQFYTKFSICIYFSIFLLWPTAAHSKLSEISGSELSRKIKNSKKPVVMNFWTTWCEPCKEEFPLFLEERKFLSGKINFYFVSLDAKAQTSEAKDFLKSQGVDFETFLKKGSDDEFITAVVPQWEGAVPMTAFYSAQGRLVELHHGVIDKAILKKNLKLLTTTKK